jgi:glycoprotein 3-alpha-L-fucosyltransferase
MRKNAAPKIRAIIYCSYVIALGLGIWKLLATFHSDSGTSSHQDAAPQATNKITHQTAAEPNHDELLIWSAERKDWALSSWVEVAGHEDASFGRGDGCLWPEDSVGGHCSTGDRIINQLKWSSSPPADKLFKIAWANDYSLPDGQTIFIRDKCTIDRCLITHNLSEADAIVFPNSDVHMEQPMDPGRRAEQIWVAHFLESPPNTFDPRFDRKHRGKHEFNWTASYRSDSDIVTPYAKFVPYLIDASRQADTFVRQRRWLEQKHRALIDRKETKVAWFVSNCHAKNNRLEFARELSQYIQVDVFGKCGNLTCNKWSQADCLDMINRDYKFYLAFENSNSREYITEKLYHNALGYNNQDHLLVPIVLGARREDYQRLAPPGSFIHVEDFESAKHLAAFLKHLGNSHELYYAYFRWKTMGKFIDTKFMCRLCSMLHHSHKTRKTKVVSDIKAWWLNEMT